MSECCVSVFWFVGLCTILEPVRGCVKGVTTLRPYIESSHKKIALDQSFFKQTPLLVVKPHFHDLNHTCAIFTFIELRTFNFLLVLFVSYVRISLLDEINRNSDMVDNQRYVVLRLQGSSLLIKSQINVSIISTKIIVTSTVPI
jgi:hypothetical protein